MGTTTTISASGTVTITKTKSVSGTITIKDGTTTIATITTSGTFDASKKSTSADVGSNNDWTVTVKVDANGTVSGSAAGSYGGTDYKNVSVVVQVDHGGH